MPTDFKLLSGEIADDIKKMLRLQGHHDTGTLEESLKEILVETPGGIALSATALGYIEELEYGVEAQDIDESKIDVRKLAGWVSRKVAPGISTQGATGIAQAIIKKWKKVGKPTRPETLLSVSLAFQQNLSRYDDMVSNETIGGFDEEFNTIKSGTI